MKTTLKYLAVLAGAVVLCGASNVRKQSRPVYLDSSKPLEERVSDALSRMTTEEKIAIIHAQSKFSSAGVPRLGIPELWATDGPHGIRAEVLWDQWNQARWTNDSIVAFPALTCLAATWNPELSHLYGKSVGEEARYRKKDILLGPGVNIMRTPLNGRNFEYMGEDPFLAGEMVVPYIKGVQENGVAACVKHYCLNNEETHRHTIDVDLDDRALYEIYLPAFRKAVQEGHCWSVMAGYNLYRGQHLCHNDRLLNKILKEEWGFDGVVISDWGGCEDTDEAIHNGLDLEFGTGTNGMSGGSRNTYDNYHLASPFLERIRKGEVGTEELDDKASRVLRLNMRTAMNTDKPFGSKCSEEHYDNARRIAAEGIVLLKNDNGNLPVDARSQNILVVGENAIKMMTVGGGSSSLKVQKEITPLQGIEHRAAESGITVKYVRGYVGDVTSSLDGVSTGQNLKDSRTPEELLNEAVEYAKSADKVIFIGGLNKSHHQDSEGSDRFSLNLSYRQDELIDALADANPNTTVVLVSGNPVAMPWIDKVASVLQTWYLGSEAGEAIADILFGDVNPSGKLPFTFPVKLEDSPAHQAGMPFPNDGKTFYQEGIFVGYRWFEHKHIPVLFPFGHGLSYTTFSYSGIKADKSVLKKDGVLNIELSVRNTGETAGAEVVQLYVRDIESSVPKAEKELKGFRKIYLEPGESKKVKFSIGKDALQYFDAEKHQWQVEEGKYEILVGASSGDIKSTFVFEYW